MPTIKKTKVEFEGRIEEREAIVELIRIFVRHFDAMQSETFALFTGRGVLQLEDEALASFDT